MRRILNKYRPYIFSGLLSGLAIISLALWQHPQNPAGPFAAGKNLEVDFLDIGQGDAILITTPSGKQALVDGGMTDAALAELAKQMPFYDRKIDYIIATHPDADHIGGLIPVMERYEVGEIFSNDAPSDSATYQKWLAIINQNHIPHHLLRQGDVLDFGDEVRFEVLWPNRSYLGGNIDNLNNTSVVGRLVFGQNEAMLTGDAETETQETLCRLPDEKLKAEIFKASHHGAQNGADECFSEKADPDWVVISVAADNPFGHPHKSALDLFQTLGAQILRTDKDGTVEFFSNGMSWQLVSPPS